MTTTSPSRNGFALSCALGLALTGWLLFGEHRFEADATGIALDVSRAYITLMVLALFLGRLLGVLYEIGILKRYSTHPKFDHKKLGLALQAQDRVVALTAMGVQLVLLGVAAVPSALAFTGMGLAAGPLLVIFGSAYTRRKSQRIQETLHPQCKATGCPVPA